jgi:hypothetical protein
MNQPALIPMTDEERAALQAEFFDRMNKIVALDKSRKEFLAKNGAERREHQKRTLQIMRTLNGEAEE